MGGLMRPEELLSDSSSNSTLFATVLISLKSQIVSDSWLTSFVCQNDENRFIAK